MLELVFLDKYAFISFGPVPQMETWITGCVIWTTAIQLVTLSNASVLHYTSLSHLHPEGSNFLHFCCPFPDLHFHFHRTRCRDPSWWLAKQWEPYRLSNLHTHPSAHSREAYSNKGPTQPKDAPVDLDLFSAKAWLLPEAS